VIVTPTPGRLYLPAKEQNIGTILRMQNRPKRDRGDPTGCLGTVAIWG
jgi:hypothetical protein